MEKELGAEFQKRKIQIDCINQLQKLHLIKQFSETIDEIERVHANDDDQIRLEGLIQITELKREIGESCE